MNAGLRHRGARFAMLVGGLIAGASGIARAQVAERAIGDPWWDEAVPATAEAPLVEVPAREMQARARTVADQNRNVAMMALRRELSLVRAACPSLGAGQRATIVAAGLRAVDEGPAANAPVVHNHRAVRPGVVIRMQVQGRASTVASGRHVEEAVTKTLAEVAIPEEFEAWQREIAARAERRRAAAVAVLVEAVDQTAMLDDAERDRLAGALTEKWQAFWDQAAMQPGLTAARLPPGVAAVVAEVLGPEDFNRWQEQLRRLPGS